MLNIKKNSKKFKTTPTLCVTATLVKSRTRVAAAATTTATTTTEKHNEKERRQ